MCYLSLPFIALAVLSAAMIVAELLAIASRQVGK